MRERPEEDVGSQRTRQTRPKNCRNRECVAAALERVTREGCADGASTQLLKLGPRSTDVRRMELTLARQPIFDRHGGLHAYELLYRPSSAGVVVSPSAATARVLVASVMEIGLVPLTGGRRAFVNVGEAMLTSSLLEVLPPSEVTIEVLEDVPATLEVLRALERLRGLGFQIALDDLVGDPPERRALLPFGDVWKLDVLEGFTPGILALLERRESLGHEPTLLAEKVESHACYAEAIRHGFELFQGYYHGRPEVRSAGALPLAATSVLRLVQRLYAQDPDIDAIESALSSDAALVVRLLRLVGSSAWGLRRPVASIQQALVLLGLVQVRRWATVLALAELDLTRSPEALRRSLVRAKLCVASGDPGSTDELFLLGLFSLLETLTGRPLAEWADELPLSGAAREALVEGSGPLSDPLSIAVAIEEGRWDELAVLEARHPEAVRRARTIVPSAWEDANRALP
jgi:c-di-GMP-related signal transduction protein